MVSTIKKSDFKQSTMLSMASGKRLMVEMAEELDYDRIGSMCRLTSRRFSRELKERGIAEIKAERVGESFVMVTAVSI